jgi:hypothetical protein
VREFLPSKESQQHRILLDVGKMIDSFKSYEQQHKKPLNKKVAADSIFSARLYIETLEKFLGICLGRII